MTDKELTREELERENAEPLPERTQMSAIAPLTGYMPIADVPPAIETMPVEPSDQV
ncbi:MAG TPA: hypothetical protein VFA56_10295 [Gaiellaceae bacterium]|nr:hypothetical protein [Gaiellaceae bacterium]